jgi:8-oxo-dGTP pyrophosphatase MutT (NUDIX family)
VSTFVLAVCAVIRDGDRVLAMRRAAHKDAGAGLWETVSGRVEPDEDPLLAMQRELAEETGLEVALDPRPIDAYVVRRNATPMCVLVYRGVRTGGEVVRSDEHDDHAWLTPAELRACTPFARLSDAVDRAFAVESREFVDR